MQIYQPLPQIASPVQQVLILLVAIILVFFIYPLASLLLQSDYYGIPANRHAPEFQLYDTKGNNVSISDYQGQYVYLMFGFLRCSSVCHSQVLLLDSISRILKRDDIQYVYLAMDSKQDKPSTLQTYFNQRGDNFNSLHAGSIKQMQSVASAFNSGFRIDGNPDSDTYTIEHPARIFLIDPEGNLRFVYMGASIDENKVVEDFYRLNPKSISART